jgi:hypothetical protein
LTFRYSIANLYSEIRLTLPTPFFIFEHHIKLMHENIQV